MFESVRYFQKKNPSKFKFRVKQFHLEREVPMHAEIIQVTASVMSIATEKRYEKTKKKTSTPLTVTFVRLSNNAALDGFGILDIRT